MGIRCLNVVQGVVALNAPLSSRDVRSFLESGSGRWLAGVGTLCWRVVLARSRVTPPTALSCGGSRGSSRSPLTPPSWGRQR